MSNLRRVILSKSNIIMLEDIIIKKLHGKIFIDRGGHYFKDNFIMIVGAILDQEEKKREVLPVSKINSIIITEVVNFILHSDAEGRDNDDLGQLSTKLDVFEDDDFFINTDTRHREVISAPHRDLDIKPVFENVAYSFETSDMHKTIDAYTSPIKLENVREIQLMKFSVDNCDYIITEYSNTFAIDNVNILIACGNYTVHDLEEEINRQVSMEVDCDLEFTLRKKTDSFCLRSKKTDVDETSKSYHVDFGTANSIGKLLGFEPKSYKLKSGGTTEGIKHRLCHNQYVNVLIECGLQELKYKVLMDVEYNKTKYFTPRDSKIIRSDGEGLFSVDGMSVKITDMYGNFYNTRGRNFNIEFRINQLKN